MVKAASEKNNRVKHNENEKEKHYEDNTKSCKIGEKYGGYKRQNLK